MPSQLERFKQSNIAEIVIGYSLVVWVLIQLIEAALPHYRNSPLGCSNTNFLTHSGLSNSSACGMGL